MIDFILDNLEIENLKLVIFCVLIGSVIGLSHLSGEGATGVKRAPKNLGWRKIIPSRY
jgi:hypothetical protein